MRIVNVAVRQCYRFNCPNCGSKLEADSDELVDVGFPYFGAIDNPNFNHVQLDEILLHRLPVKRLQLADGSSGNQPAHLGKWF